MPLGHIYVCDSRRHMIIMLDKKAHILGHFGKRWGGMGPGTSDILHGLR
jgi:hypothetical protein